MNERRVYRETFDEDPAAGGAGTTTPVAIARSSVSPSAVVSRSPWWIDYNHAPPGAGYLHMLMGLNTSGPQGESVREAAGPNRYIEGRFPADLRDAELTLTIRGELLGRGADLVLLAQGTVDGITSGWVLTGQPFERIASRCHADGAAGGRPEINGRRSARGVGARTCTA